MPPDQSFAGQRPTIGTVAKSSLPGELEPERRVKTEYHMLFVEEPCGAGPISPGRSQPQHFTSGNFGVTNQSKPWNRGEIVEADRSRRHTVRTPD